MSYILLFLAWFCATRSSETVYGERWTLASVVLVTLSAFAGMVEHFLFKMVPR